MKIGIEHWVAWLGALVVAIFGLMNFAYSTFQTQREAVGIEKRLDRMETKLDQILEQGKK